MCVTCRGRMRSLTGSAPVGRTPYAMNRTEFAALVDHTLLKPEATARQVEQVACAAREMGTASVCVNSSRVGTAALLVAGSDTKACTVIGFPLGTVPTAVK